MKIVLIAVLFLLLSSLILIPWIFGKWANRRKREDVLNRLLTDDIPTFTGGYHPAPYQGWARFHALIQQYGITEEELGITLRELLQRAITSQLLIVERTKNELEAKIPVLQEFSVGKHVVVRSILEAQMWVSKSQVLIGGFQRVSDKYRCANCHLESLRGQLQKYLPKAPSAPPDAITGEFQIA